MKKYLLIYLLFLTVINASAQNFEFGKYSAQELDMKMYSKDSAANAVVLQEFGTAQISNRDGSPLVFEHHVKIKIFNSKGFEHGDVLLRLHKQDQREETVEDIEGITFSKDENGINRSYALDKTQIYRENKSKYINQIRFAMPNLKDGCVIEYKYRIVSPFIFNFKSWSFQSDIPKVYSEYVARIPAIYNYNVVLRGGLKLSKNTAVLERECFTPGGGMKADCSQLTFAMADIPAFVEEKYMTAPSNFISAMYFELSEYSDYNGVKHKVTKDWADIDNDLKRDEMFGKQMKRKDLFKDKIADITKGTTDDLSKAKAVYVYLQKWFKWNDDIEKYSIDGIKKALERRTGSTADINLSLVSALSAAGLQAEAVILSTRNNGLINKLFPAISNFNYVVAQVDIGDQKYLLDATDPLLPFGLLPIRCINDQGRVISLEKPSYWIDLVASQKESAIYNIVLELNENGKMTGTITNYSIGYEAYNKRKKIKKFNTTDEYVENLDESMAKIKILKSDIQNLDNNEMPLSEVYEVEIAAYEKLGDNRFSFNPFFMGRTTENPFKLPERTYPVDWGAPSETKIMLRVSFPEQYQITSKPQDLSLGLPQKGGKYLTQTVVDGNQFVFSQITQLNKSVYQSDEYPYLKELFNRIVQSERADIVFKKK
ncbi:MAG: transglutaminase domain-containing protein [Janthinobacterium lividum]